MEFFNNDFLNYDDLIQLITTNFTTDKINIISIKLLKYCFINNEVFYLLQENKTYKSDKLNIKGKILSSSNQLIERSFKQLDDKDQKIISLQYKRFERIFKIEFVKEILEPLIIRLTRENTIFDLTPNEIHFNNGYIDIKEQSFQQRDISIHYITKYIKRDYRQPSKEDENKIIKHIEKIYPNKDDMKAIFYILGSALTGQASLDQEILFLLGEGSSGKSFILSLISACIECYFVELQGNTFTQGNTKIDKILNTFHSSPQARLVWVNEMEDRKMDEALFKKFMDGQLQTCVLYEDGTRNITHNAKCIVTSNDMPSIKIDSGVVRRFLGYTHQAKFVDRIENTDTSKHIYLKDKDLLNKIKGDNLLDAFISILIKYSKLWLDGHKNVLTENFNDTKDVVVNSNDIFQDFIDSRLVIDNNDESRIGKDTMRDMFKVMFPNKNLSVLQIISSLKSRGIVYDGQKRHDNIRGCYIGIRSRNDSDDDIKDVITKSHKKVEAFIDNTDEYKIKYEALLEKYEALLACRNESVQISTDIKVDDCEIKKEIKKERIKREIKEYFSESEDENDSDVEDELDEAREQELDDIANEI